jgi:nicotinate-nucleotide adenylyltransferase
MKIGILGGTFDPIHTGHLVLAQECWSRLVLDKVIFVPAYIQPLKDKEGEVSSADRLNMVRLALEEDDRFEISTFELDAKARSYTIDTIKHFRQLYEGEDIFFLTGSDSAESLSMWKDIDQILELCHFTIATRPGWGMDSPYGDRVTKIQAPGLEISSSMIRERIQKKEPIDYLVPHPVVKYIRNKGLYRE